MARDAAAPKPAKQTIALVLGGGAPTLTLMAGALAAFADAGVEFDVISTSGAGMLVGLLYAAPKGGDRARALRATVEMGVHDAIYRHFPVNYKVFYKPGPLADLWYRSVIAPFARTWAAGRDEERLLKDLMHLWLATWSPTGLSSGSLGLCQPAPWLEDVVDFDALQRFPKPFFVNAWNMRERRMRIYPKEEITPEHFRAALAFPFIYPPFRLQGDWHIEGSALNTLNLEGLLAHDEAYDRVAYGILVDELMARWPQIKRAYASGSVGQQRAAAMVRDAEAAARAASLAARGRAQRVGNDRQGGDVDAMKRNQFCRAALLRRERTAARKIDTIDRIVVFDVLGTEQLIRKPRNLYDAWVLSMIVPLVSIAANDLELFELRHDPKPPGEESKLVHRVRFADAIPSDHWPDVLDWSYGNLEELFHAGQYAARRFIASKDWLEPAAARGIGGGKRPKEP